ncbi:MAG TPA: ABC transporter permease [Cellulomonadaceae bacterium]|nr:ABC transporter permease [Cellulomonadaceae bacterium]
MTTTLSTGTTSTVPAPAAGARRRGGMNLTFLSIELRRLLRNRRTVIFTLIMPPMFFLIFGTAGSYRTTSAGHGNVTAYVMISMALYGAMLATTSGGAMVSVERAQGWSRQLRLTPLRPSVYIAIKVAVAMVLGLASVVVVYLVGLAEGAHADVSVWIVTGLTAWLGSIVFAAFGLFMGYLLPAENVMQILGPVLAVLSFAGGLFVPLGDGVFATIGKVTPLYGLAELVRAPLVGDGVTVTSVANVVLWAAVFGAGAVWRFRHDTARV